MTSVTPDTVSTAPDSRQPGALEWLRKNLFSDWFNSLLTLVVSAVLIFGVYGLIRWAFTTAQWAVIPNNMGLYMTGTYPSELYWRIWVLLGIVAAFGGITWGVLGRNLQALFASRVIVGLGVVAAFVVLFPPTRMGAPKLLPMIALVAGMAWAGRQLSRSVPGLTQWLPFLWYAASFVATWLISGGIDASKIDSFILLPITNLVVLLAALVVIQRNVG